MVDKSFKIVSYNCNSAKNSVDVIRTLIDQYDIVCLQETFLSKDDIRFIYGLRDNINFCISDCLFNISLNCGRPKGGLLTIWKKHFDSVFTPIIIEDSYQAIKIRAADGDVIVCNVYMPYDDKSIDQLIRYQEILASLSHEIECNPGCKINIVGDFNADPSRLRLWKEVIEFCNDFGLSVADLSLPSNSFTYLHPAHDTTSWLDHVLSSTPENVSNILILHYLTLYDHFPISFELVVQMDVEMGITYGVETKYFANWNKFNSCKDKFENTLESFFSKGVINSECLSCEKISCDSHYHKALIDGLYAYLIEGLLAGSDHFIHGKKDTFKQVPGWNDFCKNAHITARYYFLQWKEEGMPRDNYTYYLMKDSRANFRSALRQCRENEKRLREEKVVSSFQDKDFRTFWRQISVKNKSKASTMDGMNDGNDITRLFESKYFEILNDSNCQSKPNNFDENVKRVSQNVHSNLILSEEMVRNNCTDLKVAIGYDNIHTNHLKYATDSCINFITQLFNSMIRHSYFPSQMLRGEIRPILKNKSGRLNDSENYRPVMISSNILKLFEKCIQPHLINSLQIHCNQFGFRSHTSTNMTVTVVKEIIHHYMNNGSTVFGGFIDLSKAFDKVNHYKLINSIFHSNLNSDLKLIIQQFLLKQSAYVNYNGYKSDIHGIGNGCRQGGINSPLLFSFYINDMIENIVRTKTGCQLALHNYSIIAYADDLVILGPSQSSLQYLLNMVFEHLQDLDLSINTIKSKVLIFRPKNYKVPYEVKFFINNVSVEIVKNIKYLGVIISDDMSNKLDIERQSKAFLKQSFGFLKKFGSYPIDLKTFLFKAYCLSMFGSELWYELKGCSQTFNALKITFHKGIKKMLGLPFRSSNHDACIAANLLTFDHFRNMKIFNFGFQIKNSRSLSLQPIKGYLLRSSMFMKNLNIISETCYGISYLLDNDRDAIASRINYVFMREPRFQGINTV